MYIYLHCLRLRKVQSFDDVTEKQFCVDSSIEFAATTKQRRDRFRWKTQGSIVYKIIALVFESETNFLAICEMLKKPRDLV